MNKSAEHHAKASRTQRSGQAQTPIGKPSRTKQALDFLRAHKPKQNGSSECLKPRTLAQLKSHAYASEITRIELAIVSLESLSGRTKTIPLTAGMAMDDALLALYKAKGAFDCFQNEER